MDVPVEDGIHQLCQGWDTEPGEQGTNRICFGREWGETVG